MAWVRVWYEEARRVHLDGEDIGNTNKLIYIGADGTYVFDLGEPVDYKPRSMPRRVVNTSRSRPLELTFEPRAE